MRLCGIKIIDPNIEQIISKEEYKKQPQPVSLSPIGRGIRLLKF
jgi:hypothetical protein